MQPNPHQLQPHAAAHPRMAAMRTGTIENPLRLAVFISGSGSGMEALLHYQASNPCLHDTVLVLSNVAGVAGLKKATNFGVDTVVVEIDKSIPDSKVRRESHEKEIMKLLEKHNIEAVILSGYMRIMSPLFVSVWKGRLLNIHPSLLPKYPGAHAHKDALADGATVTGCTVHFVDEGVDSGPIIAQEEVPVMPNDDESTLSERVKKVEHILYPIAIDKFASGTVKFS
ncbi:MAG: phosphoribosylglycinamide formyltransferase [Candidatus Thermoplasmatota archaeon]|nr:phosphoribosylglycinamide formyltransferase [Candidatus Thermoplasmatota archaeon]